MYRQSKHYFAIYSMMNLFNYEWWIMNDELGSKQRISRIKRIFSCSARCFLGWWLHYPDMPWHVPTVWGGDYAGQCRDATCGVRDTALIASVEDARRVEDPTLFERPCAQPRRGAPLGHKRAEQLVPRRGTLNAPAGKWSSLSGHLCQDDCCLSKFCLK